MRVFGYFPAGFPYPFQPGALATIIEQLHVLVVVAYTA